MKPKVIAVFGDRAEENTRILSHTLRGRPVNVDTPNDSKASGILLQTADIFVFWFESHISSEFEFGYAVRAFRAGDGLFVAAEDAKVAQGLQELMTSIVPGMRIGRSFDEIVVSIRSLVADMRL